MVIPAASQRSSTVSKRVSKKKRASDSFESLDARAALPKNCSLRNLGPHQTFVNGTSDLKYPTKVLHLRDFASEVGVLAKNCLLMFGLSSRYRSLCARFMCTPTVRR